MLGPVVYWEWTDQLCTQDISTSIHIIWDETRVWKSHEISTVSRAARSGSLDFAETQVSVITLVINSCRICHPYAIWHLSSLRPLGGDPCEYMHATSTYTLRATYRCNQYWYTRVDDLTNSAAENSARAWFSTTRPYPVDELFLKLPLVSTDLILLLDTSIESLFLILLVQDGCSQWRVFWHFFIFQVLAKIRLDTVVSVRV